MYNFGAAVAWYFLVMFTVWAIATIKTKRSGGVVDVSDINLDTPVLSLVYLVYYYFDFL